MNNNLQFCGEDAPRPTGIDQDFRDVASGIAVQAARIPGTDERETFLDTTHGEQYRRMLDSGSGPDQATDHAPWSQTALAIARHIDGADLDMVKRIADSLPAGEALDATTILGILESAGYNVGNLEDGHDKQSAVNMQAALSAQDVSQNPHYVRMRHSNTRSEIAVPIRVKGQVIGVLDAQSDRVNDLSSSTLLVTP